MSERKKRFRSKVYYTEKYRWENHHFVRTVNKDGYLFSGNVSTKILPKDLPEWYIYGRYHKRFGYICAKGVVDMIYVPNRYTNHFLKDDDLFISYSGKIIHKENARSWPEYEGHDEVVFGSDILTFLKAAKIYSNYDITPIVEQLREKQIWLATEYPDEFGPGKWQFDIDKWLEEPLYNHRP